MALCSPSDVGRMSDEAVRKLPLPQHVRVKFKIGTDGWGALGVEERRAYLEGASAVAAMKAQRKGAYEGFMDAVRQRGAQTRKRTKVHRKKVQALATERDQAKRSGVTAWAGAGVLLLLLVVVALKTKKARAAAKKAKAKAGAA